MDYIRMKHVTYGYEPSETTARVRLGCVQVSGMRPGPTYISRPAEGPGDCQTSCESTADSIAIEASAWRTSALASNINRQQQLGPPGATHNLRVNAQVRGAVLRPNPSRDPSRSEVAQMLKRNGGVAVITP
jgi:hypothetical protein